MQPLQDKMAIVTGAGGGIGAAICRQFAAEGAAVVGIDIDAYALERMAASVHVAKARVSTLCADVSEEATAEEAVVHAREKFGRLDVLVSNAVYDLPHAPLTAVAPADWRRTMAVNLDSAFLFSKHAIPAMEAARGGSIILIASQLGRVAGPGRTWYFAAKGALIRLAKAMALTTPGRTSVSTVCRRGRSKPRATCATSPPWKPRAPRTARSSAASEHRTKSQRAQCFSRARSPGS